MSEIRDAADRLRRTSEDIGAAWQDAASRRFRREVVDGLVVAAVALDVAESRAQQEIREASRDL